MKLLSTRRGACRQGERTFACTLLPPLCLAAVISTEPSKGAGGAACPDNLPGNEFVFRRRAHVFEASSDQRRKEDCVEEPPHRRGMRLIDRSHARIEATGAASQFGAGAMTSAPGTQRALRRLPKSGAPMDWRCPTNRLRRSSESVPRPITIGAAPLLGRTAKGATALLKSQTRAHSQRSMARMTGAPRMPMQSGRRRRHRTKSALPKTSNRIPGLRRADRDRSDWRRGMVFSRAPL